MIAIDLAWAGGACAALAIALFFWGQALLQKKSFGSGKTAGYVRQCPYCGHVSVERELLRTRICSLCKSYLEENAP
jgi:hypothetical protein